MQRGAANAHISDVPLTLQVRDSREFSLTLFDNSRKLQKLSVPHGFSSNLRFAREVQCAER